MVCIAEQSLSNLTFMNSSILGFTWGTVWKVGGERKASSVCLVCWGEGGFVSRQATAIGTWRRPLLFSKQVLL